MCCNRLSSLIHTHAGPLVVGKTTHARKKVWKSFCKPYACLRFRLIGGIESGGGDYPRGCCRARDEPSPSEAKGCRLMCAAKTGSALARRKVVREWERSNPPSTPVYFSLHHIFQTRFSDTLPLSLLSYSNSRCMFTTTAASSFQTSHHVQHRTAPKTMCHGVLYSTTHLLR